MAEFYWIHTENHDEIFDKCLWHTIVLQECMHIIVHHVSSAPGPKHLIKHKIWPRCEKRLSMHVLEGGPHPSNLALRWAKGRRKTLLAV